MMMCIYCSQWADELNWLVNINIWFHQVVMDKDISEERELEEPSSSSLSISPGTHKSIFDLPTEIITHIVSFLSLQGKNMKSRWSSVLLPLAVMFRCLQTGGNLSPGVLHHSRRAVLGAPPSEGVRGLLHQGQGRYWSVSSEEQGESIWDNRSGSWSHNAGKHQSWPCHLFLNSSSGKPWDVGDLLSSVQTDYDWEEQL